MRPVFFLAALGLFWLFGPLLFSIWFIAVVLAIVFFAARGIRHFIRTSRDRDRYGYLPGRSPMWFHTEKEPLLLDEWAEERIIPVE